MLYILSRAPYVEANEDRPILSVAERYLGCIDFSDVQIMDTIARWVTTNLDFKVTMFFSVKYLENGTRQSSQWQTNRNSYMTGWKDVWIM